MIITPQYKCPHCRSIYKDSDDAEDCARECSKPIIIKINSYTCEYCKSNSLVENTTQKCETNHKTNNDHYYQTYLDIKEKERLYKAAQHKAQTKLIKKREDGNNEGEKNNKTV